MKNGERPIVERAGKTGVLHLTSYDADLRSGVVKTRVQQVRAGEITAEEAMAAGIKPGALGIKREQPLLEPAVSQPVSADATNTALLEVVRGFISLEERRLDQAGQRPTQQAGGNLRDLLTSALSGVLAVQAYQSGDATRGDAILGRPTPVVEPVNGSTTTVEAEEPVVEAQDGGESRSQRKRRHRKERNARKAAETVVAEESVEDPRYAAVAELLKTQGKVLERSEEGVRLEKLSQELDQFAADMRAAGLVVSYDNEGKITDVREMTDDEKTAVAKEDSAEGEGRSGRRRRKKRRKNRGEKVESEEERTAREFREGQESLLALYESPEIRYLHPIENGVFNTDEVRFRVFAPGAAPTTSAEWRDQLAGYVGASEGAQLEAVMQRIQERLDNRQLTRVVSSDGKTVETQWLLPDQGPVNGYKLPDAESLSGRLVHEQQDTMRRELDAQKALAERTRTAQEVQAAQPVELTLHDRTLRIVQEFVKATKPKQSRWLGARTWNYFFNTIRPDHSVMAHTIADFNKAQEKGVALRGTGVKLSIKVANALYYPAWGLVGAPTGVAATGGAFLLDGLGRGLARGLHEAASALERVLEGPDRWLDEMAMNRVVREGYTVVRVSDLTGQAEQQASAQLPANLDDLLGQPVRVEAAPAVEAVPVEFDEDRAVEVAPGFVQLTLQPAAESAEVEATSSAATAARRSSLAQASDAMSAYHADIERQLDEALVEEELGEAGRVGPRDRAASNTRPLTREELGLDEEGTAIQE